MSDNPAIVRVSDSRSLLAVVPHLLTFQPENSLVVIGTAPPRGEIRLTLRYDLPDPADTSIAREIALHALSVMAAQEIETAVAVGYGPGTLVTPVIDALRGRAAETGLQITELLRAENHRYWSYLCTNPACCPPEGVPYNMNTPETEALSVTGKPVLGSRAALAATLAPVTGDDAALMQQAAQNAADRAATLVQRPRENGSHNKARRAIAKAGKEAVIDAIGLYRAGRTLTAGPAAAWLILLLQDLQVRDDAWCRMDPEHRRDHLRLWTDLTRLAQPGYVAPPAALLAFTAWQSGNGALANVALDRALDDNPDYSMAGLLRQAIDSGAPPALARIPMSPKEVADSYEDAWDDDQNEAEAGCPNTDDTDADQNNDNDKNEDNQEEDSGSPVTAHARSGHRV